MLSSFFAFTSRTASVDTRSVLAAAECVGYKAQHGIQYPKGKHINYLNELQDKESCFPVAGFVLRKDWNLSLISHEALTLWNKNLFHGQTSWCSRFVRKSHRKFPDTAKVLQKYTAEKREFLTESI